jgi:hypothetical protein
MIGSFALPRTKRNKEDKINKTERMKRKHGEKAWVGDEGPLRSSLI